MSLRHGRHKYNFAEDETRAVKVDGSFGYSAMFVAVSLGELAAQFTTADIVLDEVASSIALLFLSLLVAGTVLGVAAYRSPNSFGSRLVASGREVLVFTPLFWLFYAFLDERLHLALCGISGLPDAIAAIASCV